MKDTLCWKCKKSVGGEDGCSWFNGFKPIPNWEAERTDISYKITRCPEYISERTKRVGQREISIKDISLLLKVSERTVIRLSETELSERLRIRGIQLEINKKGQRRKFYIKEIEMEEKEKEYSEKIFKILESDRLNRGSRGYTYLFDALYIGMTSEDIKTKTYNYIFNKVAEKYQDKIQNVERTIRYCIKDSEIGKTFTEYLNVVRMKIRVGNI